MTDAQQTYTRLYSAWNSGYLEPVQQVLKTAAELAAAWRAIHGGSQGEPVPKVDFSRQMVVLLALGQRPTGGYSLKFDGTSSSGIGVVVSYTITVPGPGCMTAQVLSSPVELVAVPRMDGVVHFDATQVVQRC